MSFIKSLLRYKIFWLAIIYIVLMIWSSLYRFQTPQTKLSEDKKYIQLNTISGEKTLFDKINVAFIEKKAEVETNAIPVILIHGSPGSADAFKGLVKNINNRRLIAVDLPGFGDSDSDISDYSIYAHSQYVIELLKKLEIEKAHFVGFSLGGGVVLHIEEIEPSLVQSISMVAAIGVQEYELFGNYYINHFIHGLQLGFFWVLKELTPHFGVFDGMLISYARNFYDTDQRPLREILQRFEKPFQIIHGKDDPLVPVEAAREHSRIVPQSEYHELEDNHFFVFMRPKKIQKLLENFWKNVENKTAKIRSTADSERIAESTKPFKAKVLEAKGATLFVLCLLIIFLVFINEDFAFLLAGFFAAQGRFGIGFAIIISIIGGLLSIFLMILLGRFWRKKGSNVEDLNKNILKRKFFRFRFLEYFQTGKAQNKLWKHLILFISSVVFWAIILNLASYIFSTIIFQIF